MFNCPACHTPLVRHRNAIGIFWSCESCSGNAFTLGPLRRFLDKDTVNNMWQDARAKEPDSFRACPSCEKSMRLCSAKGEYRDEELDICVTCQMVWFDHAELNSLPRLTSDPPYFPLKSKQVPDWDFKPIPRSEYTGDTGEDMFSMILAWLGMPIEDSAQRFTLKLGKHFRQGKTSP